MLCPVFQIPPPLGKRRGGKETRLPRPPRPWVAYRRHSQCHISPETRLPLLTLCPIPLECCAVKARALTRCLFDQLGNQPLVTKTRPGRGVFAHILTLPSSPAVAYMHGSAGFQATALQLVWCASASWTRMPVTLCQIKTRPSANLGSATWPQNPWVNPTIAVAPHLRYPR